MTARNIFWGRKSDLGSLSALRMLPSQDGEEERTDSHRLLRGATVAAIAFVVVAECGSRFSSRLTLARS